MGLIMVSDRHYKQNHHFQRSKAIANDFNLVEVVGTMLTILLRKLSSKVAHKRVYSPRLSFSVC